ncbi:type II toxin-antitoxin system RelE/ParE family toxin [Caulobacter hibisci]|uniref:Toxin n=1 Tax=Caulobacter hibisci TaxID=2035993 RepID=A0ABS0SZN6_9CAUL|nr:type II toxin-antitoxin system RelE/ParE family toxin [Caulobacter hibisci]MBI1685085.1 type II toxin-antitoxin system RelE/ParE family toxin [Caulobacter hibisci]
MSGYRLSFKARHDIDDIRAFSKGQWGARRAAAYLRDIKRALDLIGLHPEAGRRDDRLTSVYRRHTVGSHVVFYRPDRGMALIVRILHQQMDPSSHL